MTSTRPDDIELLRAEIAQTRADLGATAEALAAKTDVKARARESVQEMKDRAHALTERARTSAGAMKDRVRANGRHRDAGQPALTADGEMMSADAETVGTEGTGDLGDALVPVSEEPAGRFSRALRLSRDRRDRVPLRESRRTTGSVRIAGRDVPREDLATVAVGAAVGAALIAGGAGIVAWNRRRSAAKRAAAARSTAGARAMRSARSAAMWAAQAQATATRAAAERAAALRDAARAVAASAPDDRSDPRQAWAAVARGDLGWFRR